MFHSFTFTSCYFTIPGLEKKYACICFLFFVIITKTEVEDMKVKRTLLVLSMVVLFLFCYQYMNSKYDPFARYGYMNDQNEKIIRDHISDPSDIEYIISQKIKPEQFMNFIELPGFKVRNILYYDACEAVRPMDSSAIINFVNSYRGDLDLQTFELRVKNYAYESLAKYYDEGYFYIEDAAIVDDPSNRNLILKENETFLDYIPADLMRVEQSVIPSAPAIPGEEIILLREEVIEPLTQMMQEVAKMNNTVAGGYILTSGYISYQNQIELYKNALNLYGTKTFSLYSDYPGRSEDQLGYSFNLQLSGVSDQNLLLNNDTYKWLQDNAYKYGFIFRYPKDEEGISGKYFQPLKLRYVGKENAREVFETKQTFNQIDYAAKEEVKE